MPGVSLRVFELTNLIFRPPAQSSRPGYLRTPGRSIPPTGSLNRILSPMRQLIILLCLFVGNCLHPMAQSSQSFRTDLVTYPQGTSHRGSGSFTLANDTFSGVIGFRTLGESFDYVRIENSAGIVFNASSYGQSPPEVVYQANWQPRLLSSVQVQELNNGGWSVHIGHSSSGEPFLVGQITVVPEPSIFAVACAGAIILLLSANRPATRGDQFRR